MHVFRWTGVSLAAAAISILGNLATVSAQSPGMIEFFSGGKLQKGLPLVELAHETVVMGRDGWMHSIDPRRPDSQIRSLKERYSPASAPELRNELRAEFGRNFEVQSTQHFLVVQPRGRGDRWPRMFEQSHRAFITYMSKRGVQIRSGRFPMVAIVFPDELAMYRELRKQEIDVSRVAGLYSGDSNRVVTHDGGQTAQTAATVRHEAAHQSAFNSGVHSRVNDTPRWITEGIGQMFEPAAMADPRGASALNERVNQDSIRYLKRKFDLRYGTKFSRAALQLIGDDTMFEDSKQIDDAYAVSWAMMFYLAERKSDAFAAILNHTSKRPPFRPYERSDRLKDFERITGYDVYEFGKYVSRYINSL